MPALVDQRANPVEPLDIRLLGGRQGVRPEVRKDSLDKIPDVPNFELQGLVRPIGPDEAATPSFSNHREEFGSLRVLADRKARSNLPTKPVSPTGLKRNTEAAFSIDETRDVGIDVHSAIVRAGVL